MEKGAQKEDLRNELVVNLIVRVTERQNNHRINY